MHTHSLSLSLALASSISLYSLALCLSLSRNIPLSFLDGYCSTVQGLLDWFEVDLGFTELLFIQTLATFLFLSLSFHQSINLSHDLSHVCIVCVCVCVCARACVCVSVCVCIQIHTLPEPLTRSFNFFQSLSISHTLTRSTFASSLACERVRVRKRLKDFSLPFSLSRPLFLARSRLHALGHARRACKQSYTHTSAKRAYFLRNGPYLHTFGCLWL